MIFLFVVSFEENILSELGSRWPLTDEQHPNNLGTKKPIPPLPLAQKPKAELDWPGSRLAPSLKVMVQGTGLESGPLPLHGVKEAHSSLMER